MKLTYGGMNMICPKCGKTLPENAVKCNKCGEIFKEVKKNSETDEFLKKEKEKADEKAKKLKEKRTKEIEKAASKDPVKAAKTKKILKIVIPCVAVVIAAAVAVTIIVSNKNKKEKEEFERSFPELLIEYTYPEVSKEEAVMTLGDINISDAEYEFFYRQSFSGVQNNAQLEFKQYVGQKLGKSYDDSKDYYSEYYKEYSKGKKNLFDFTKPAASQTDKALDEDGNEISWQEYIRNDAIKTMMNYHVKFILAKEDGIELTDDIRKQVYDHIEGLRDAIKGSGYQNLDQYLKILFGSSCDEEFFKNELIREYIAAKYDIVKNSETMKSYSQDEIKALYEKEHSKYDYIDLSVYEVVGKDAKERAQKIVKETKDLNSFSKAICKYTDDTQSCRSMPLVPKEYIDQTYSADMGKWAYDSQRKFGDTAVFKTPNGYSAAFLEKPLYTTENNVSYREIVINKTDSQGNMLSGDALTQAEQKADDIYEKWKTGDADENSFTYLAFSESEGSSAPSGGLVQCILASDLNEGINTWVSDKGRKYGDNQIFETDNSYTIVFFVENYNEYWNYIIRAQKAADDCSEEYSKATDGKYKESMDISAISSEEETILTDINKIYFGIGV